MDVERVQEYLLGLLPYWNYRIAKPFKQQLDEHVSLEMYYSIQMLRCHGEMTMTEFARALQMPKQQMTKLVNRLFEDQFVERVYDPEDRRVIKIVITKKALDYIGHFLNREAGCFRDLITQMDEADRDAFGGAVETILRILSKLDRESEIG